MSHPERMTGIVRPATLEDLEGLFALARACPGAAAWSRATWAQTLDSAQSATAQPASAEPSPAARVVLVTALRGVLTGFSVLHAIGDAGEIENLGVSPAFQRTGMGRALSEGLLDWARERGLQHIHLEVRASNLAAQHLYERLGFTTQAIRRGYYQGPEEDALLMELATNK